MIRKFPVPLVVFLLTSQPLTAQVTEVAERKEASAIRVVGDAIRVDGRLDEAIWSRAQPIDDFVQKEPIEGAPPTERTEVRFAYDDDALYVAARMYSSEGRAGIQAPLGRRDDGDQAESILISLDTHLDRRTAYSFGVTAAGVRLDHFHRADSETITDPGFNPVWEAKVTIDDQGWTAEMWIPLSQLRFASLPEQVWGLNIRRWIPSKNEAIYWIAIPRTQERWASAFGDLRGIESLTLSRRVEVLPYVLGGSTVNGARDPGDPFDDGRNLEAQVGADIKMGLGPNLTLDATIYPDFGQVEADPAVVNLSTNETIFQERRPFFTEGMQLISGEVSNYFYSRRIGAPPPGRASGDYIDRPRNTPILGAAKLTGRLPSGTSIGILTAVTGDAFARTFDITPGSFQRIRVAPRTEWGVARVQQEFGDAGSTASLMIAGVHRELDPGDPLASLLTRNALTVASETVWRLANGTYEVGLSGGLSHVTGERDAIVRVQQASPRYFQSPDRSHTEVDTTLTSLSGYKATATARKISGAHWLWNFSLDFESPSVEFNDIGRLFAGDGIMLSNDVTYRETSPGALFRNYRLTIGQTREWDYGRSLRWNRLNGSAGATWNNFWTTNASTQLNLRGQEWQLTRGGPMMETPLGWTTTLRVQNSNSERTRWNANLNVGRDELGGRLGRVEAGASWLPGPRWQITISPSYEEVIDPRQYVATLGGGPASTYGSRYIFAFIDRTTLALQGRLNLTFKPDLNLDLYAEPYAASGRYYGFGELEAAGSRNLRTYGSDGTQILPLPGRGFEVRDGAAQFLIANRDFNVRSFRSTSVLRWEMRPGSTLYLVWQQDRSEEEALATPARIGDMFGSLTSVGNNYFAIKASYWLAQ